MNGVISMVVQAVCATEGYEYSYFFTFNFEVKMLSRLVGINETIDYQFGLIKDNYLQLC